eukprot:Gregarina_sp_Pseudo_9__5458@NODE_68_length_4604_cov_482_516101_g63_i0_p2_GENE_NODE_68_length_4604_cov_482_516101_g63_i0NODE_68_length_4604_cov_482_516101_g63_i0_p2_ORF_typecomplete_len449_score159_96_NODE_68_length_4604_cov_482_516101_g63_i05821928
MLLCLWLLSAALAVWGYRGDGLNVTSWALREALRAKFGSTDLASLAADPVSVSVDILLLVEEADGGEPHQYGFPQRLLWDLVQSLAQDDAYSHHRLAMAVFDNKPIPGKGVLEFSNWMEAETKTQRNPAGHEVSVYGCPLALPAAAPSRCYANALRFGALGDANFRASLVSTTQSVLCNMREGPSRYSASLDAIIAAVSDPALQWRDADTPKLVVVMPSRKPELANRRHDSAQWMLDGWEWMLPVKDPECVGPAIGDPHQKMNAYGNRFTTPPDFNYNKVLQEQMLACVENGFEKTLWERKFHTPYTHDPMQTFDPAKLAADPDAHCFENEYPTSQEFVDWVAANLDESWHVAWFATSYNDPAVTEERTLTRNTREYDVSPRNGSPNGEETRQEFPDLYALGDLFLKGRDPALWKWQTLVRTALTPSDAVAAMDYFLHWATLLDPAAM